MTYFSIRILRIYFWTFILAAIPQHAISESYGMFSKHEELRANAVVDAGDFERVDVSSERLDYREILKMNSNCFETTKTTGGWGYGKKAGLVLVDRNKTIHLALIESSIGSINIESYPAVQVSCSREAENGAPLELQQQIQEYKRKNEVRKLELERLRKQIKIIEK